MARLIRLSIRSFLVATLVIAATVTSCTAAVYQGSSWQRVFAERVARYLTVREEAVREVGALHSTEDASALIAATAELAERIRTLRAAAREGDVFAPPAADAIRAALRRGLSTTERHSILDALYDVQPESLTVSVNEVYPSAEPVATMPPAFASALPQLPPVLSYRFVDRDLLLLDRNTRLIVDVLRNALPPSAGSPKQP